MLADFIPLADVGQDRVGQGPRRGDATDREADLVGGGLDAEARRVGEAFVERAVVPEIGLGAADTRMARLYGVAGAVVPPHGGAGVVGGRAFAADLVEAVA